MNNGRGEFAQAFGVFFLLHIAPMRHPARPQVVARQGPRGCAVVYSDLALAAR